MRKLLAQLVKSPKILFTDLDKQIIKRAYTQVNQYLVQNNYKDVQALLLYDHIALKIVKAPVLVKDAFMDIEKSKEIERTVSVHDRTVQKESQDVLAKLREIMPGIIRDVMTIL